ncbi:hypothetical protein FQ192_17015 [Pseudomonas sp. ANT_J12]|jgi:hypothetical protein|nr:hypothetical protein FQ192_17015 [Pseudomonas sp. ANT_J12]
MSRSLGLREDQRLGEQLAMRIAGLFPLDGGDPFAGKPCSYRNTRSVGARLARDDGRSVTAKIRP